MGDIMKNVYYLEDSDFDFSNPNEIKLTGFKKLGMHNKPVLVLVFASWCGYCQKFKPDFQAFANIIKEMGEPIYVATIQADGKEQGQVELSKKLRTIFKDFRGFPDVYMFKNNKLNKKFDRERTKDALMSFCKENYD